MCQDTSYYLYAILHLCTSSHHSLPNYTPTLSLSLHTHTHTHGCAHTHTHTHTHTRMHTHTHTHTHSSTSPAYPTSSLPECALRPSRTSAPSPVGWRATRPTPPSTPLPSRCPSCQPSCRHRGRPSTPLMCPHCRRRCMPLLCSALLGMQRFCQWTRHLPWYDVRGWWSSGPIRLCLCACGWVGGCGCVFICSYSV